MKKTGLRALQRDDSNFMHEENGATLLEYALIVCIIAVAAVFTLGNLGIAVQYSIWSAIEQAFAAYASGG